MALSPKLELRQSQTLVMTPQLQQAIKLLQLSNIDIAQFVEQEIERNPLLDYDDSAPGESAHEPDGGASSKEINGIEAKNVDGGDGGGDIASSDSGFNNAGDPSGNGDAPLDTSYENVYDTNATDDRIGGSGGDSSGTSEAPAFTVNWSGGGGGGQGFADGADFEATLSSAPNLRDHLTAQLNISALGDTERLIGQYLIDFVNDAGYLTETIENAAERLGATVAEVEAVLTIMQGFEPTGVFARGLAECLALQLAEQDRLDPCMQTFLDNIDLLAKGDLAALRRACTVSQEDLSDMIDEVRALNPKPGNAFNSEPVQPIIPDVFVREGNDGAWTVELNSETLPRVLVNSHYYTIVKNTAQNTRDKEFINECLQSANWLTKSLDQRARTILKVASEIVRQQDAFFAHGVKHLKPLNLRTIAELIDMHESTVSRVTVNKYMATPRGVFELKYFFSTAIAASNGEATYSSESVRQMIRELIDGENADAILSDDKIVDILRNRNVDIARRTVAKYREAMRIPSSVARRRLKRNKIAR